MVKMQIFRYRQLLLFIDIYFIKNRQLSLVIVSYFIIIVIFIVMTHERTINSVQCVQLYTSYLCNLYTEYVLYSVQYAAKCNVLLNIDMFPCQHTLQEKQKVNSAPLAVICNFAYLALFGAQRMSAKHSFGFSRDQPIRYLQVLFTRTHQSLLTTLLQYEYTGTVRVLVNFLCVCTSTV